MQKWSGAMVAMLLLGAVGCGPVSPGELEGELGLEPGSEPFAQTRNALILMGEFYWDQYRAATPMGPVGDRVCFLTGVKGKFEGPGESVHAYTNNGSWYLGGGSYQADVGGWARCVAVGDSSWFTQEYTWQQGQASVDLGSTTGRTCFLTRVSGKFLGIGETVRIFMDNNHWYLGGNSGQYGVTASARCVYSDYNSPDEVSWSPGQPAQYVSPYSGRACFLTRMAGNFRGGAESVRVSDAYYNVPQAYWYLGGTGQTELAASTRCIGNTIKPPSCTVSTVCSNGTSISCTSDQNSCSSQTSTSVTCDGATTYCPTCTARASCSSGGYVSCTGPGGTCSSDFESVTCGGTITECPISSTLNPRPVVLWTTNYSDAEGWSSDASYWQTIRFPDLNGDGKKDVCGRGVAGLICALSNGTSFGPPTLWSSNYSNAEGWSSDASYWQTIRFPDLNGDGREDVCGRGVTGLICALSNGTSFGLPTLWSSNYSNAEGWQGDVSHWQTLQFVDLDGDGRMDVCGRGVAGLLCAQSTGSAFGAPFLWSYSFSNVQGWASSPSYWRTLQLQDMDGDGRADACARRSSGIVCAR